jgi:GNAT superfamily N-acetyltransferase
MNAIILTSEPNASPEDEQFLRDSLDHFNMETVQDYHYIPVRLFLRDETGAIHGGLIAHIWGGWLHLDYLWVDEAHRKHGYGKQLVQRALDEAHNQHCRGAYLTTFTFQARPFYERFGFEVVAEVPDYPPGHTYYFMRSLF